MAFDWFHSAFRRVQEGLGSGEISILCSRVFFSDWAENRPVGNFFRTFAQSAWTIIIMYFYPNIM